MKTEPLASKVLGLAARVVEGSSKEHPADAVLRTVLKTTRGFSREESREVARAVFSYFRWFGWIDKGRPSSAGLKHAFELDQAFRERPGTFSDEKLLARAVPSWIKETMPVTGEWVRGLQSEPSLWLRARVGKSQDVMERLQGPSTVHRSLESGAGTARPRGPSGDESSPPRFVGSFGACQAVGEILPGTLKEGAIRYSGLGDLFQTSAFHEGLFELQDLSSQVVGWVCDPKPGETWWDACAGEGGKTLHLSDLMENKGLIWASDRAKWRLDILKKRAARSRCFNYRSALWDGGEKLPTKTKFDGVLMDAPCSGVGTWQRNPHGRWTLQPEDVVELAALQQRLLSNASHAVKEGGRLIYSVCTLTTSECDGVCGAFAESHPEFEPEPFSVFGAAGEVSKFWLKPPGFPGNGMFIACWRKRK